VTRFLIAGLAVCWLAVGASAWRHRRRDGRRHGPVRWHRAVHTLSAWSTDTAGIPVAATWCQPVIVPMTDVPRQRSVAADADGELSGAPLR
jgi:hypothetical protein